MKTKLSKLVLSTFIFLCCLPSNILAFEYNITFTASGAANSIQSIVVQNITQGTKVTLSPGNSLNLTAIGQVIVNDESLHIYPNPVQGKANVRFYSTQGGNTQINVFSIDGKTLVSRLVKLEAGTIQFQLSLPKGVFTLQINENGLLHNAKIISQNKENKTDIEFNSTIKAETTGIHKAKSTVIPFSYNIGDLLLFIAYSGNYTAILTDIVSGSKTICFNFVECLDQEGNNYPIVTIGNQTWIAENLKTSRYRNNVVISDKTNDPTWGTTTTAAYSDYSSPITSNTYGKLYNWYAATNNNNLAPLGWHIPTDADWNTLSDYLGGLALAGSKLKDKGNSQWLTQNTDATNTTGFSAIPGGTRSTDGNMYDFGNIGYWWSSSVGSNANSGWYRYLRNCQ